MSQLSKDRLAVSFEVFPAANDVAQASLKKCVDTLARMKPRFFSVTYGANGSDQLRTGRTLSSLRTLRTDLPVAGHLTCAGSTREGAIEVAKSYENAGARWAVALRGDAQGGAGKAFVPHEGGFTCASELVGALREQTSLRIAVGGYPEAHPDSTGEQADMDHLKRKVDAGADAILTQFFFENDVFYDYVDRCRKAGIDVPIIPGIMPIRNFKRMAGFAAKCGTSIPVRLADRFEKAEERGASRDLALAVCAGQCDELRDQGVKAFHFYTLNDADLTFSTCQALGLDPVNPVDGDGVRVSDDLNVAVHA